MSQISATLLNTLNAANGVSGGSLVGMLSSGKTSAADSIFQASITARRKKINETIEKYCKVSVDTDTEKYEKVALATTNTKKFLDALENPDLYEEKQETRDQILAKYVDNHNKLLENVEKIGGVLQNTYGNKLLELAKDQKDTLAGMGISVDENGKWTLDTDKLKSVNSEDMKKVFADAESFGKKEDKIFSEMNEILNQALYIKQALNSNYGKTGYKTDSYIQSKFNSFT